MQLLKKHNVTDAVRNEKQNQSYPEWHSNNKIRQDLTHTLQQVNKTNKLHIR